MGDPILEVWGVKGELESQELRQSKAHPRLPQKLSIQNVALSAAVWPQFQCQVKLPPQFDPVWAAVRVDRGLENGTIRNVVPAFLFDFHAQCRSILYNLATIHNADDRQSDRGSLKIERGSFDPRSSRLA